MANFLLSQISLTVFIILYLVRRIWPTVRQIIWLISFAKPIQPNGIILYLLMSILLTVRQIIWIIAFASPNQPNGSILQFVRRIWLSVRQIIWLISFAHELVACSKEKNSLSDQNTLFSF